MPGHGYGYCWSSLDVLLKSSTYDFIAKTFAVEEALHLNDSGFIEFVALRDYCINHMTPGTQIMWVTDNQCCVNRVNLFRYQAAVVGDPSARTLFEGISREIMQICLEKGCFIRATWIPRRQNELADYLSHLAFAAGGEVAGREVNDLTAFPLTLFFKWTGPHPNPVPPANPDPNPTPLPKPQHFWIFQ